jgi:formylglycine-generating enzyme required for sulfatase activity
LEQNDGEELPVKTLHVQLRDLMDTKGVRQVPVEGSWRMDSNRDGEFIFLKKDVQLDAWNALDTSDKNALNAFVQKYPKSPFLSDATAFIQEIEAKDAKKRQIDEAQRKVDAEKAAFEHAMTNPSAYNLNQFLKNYPLSTYFKNIEKRLAEAEEEAAWKQAKYQNSITAYRLFIKGYPNSDLVDGANKRIEEKEKALEDAEKRKYEQPKPPVIFVTPKVETLVPIEQPKPTIVENPKEKEVQSIENKKIKKVVVPLFLHNITLFLLAGSLISGFYIFWVMFPHIKSNTNNESKQTNFSVIEPTKSVLDTQKTLAIGVSKVESSTPSISTALIEPAMVKVAGGTFQMGDNFGDAEASKDEQPVHSVTLSDYYIGKYEVSQAEWKAVMGGKNPSNFKGDNLPVEQVSWEDVQIFIKKLNEQSGKKYRLPTEAEWEFAARERGKKVRFGNGKDIVDPSEINFDASASDKKSYSVMGTYRQKTVSVSSLSSNALGLYHMSGNVYEWCSDWYDENYYKNSSLSNPKGAVSGSDRVLRGGSWLVNPDHCRSMHRNRIMPTYRNSRLGFRLASSFL